MKMLSSIKSQSCLEKMRGNFNDIYDNLKNTKLWRERSGEIKDFLNK
jgi:hypothetical protein